MFKRQNYYYFCEKSLTYKPVEKSRTKIFLKIFRYMFSMFLFLFLINVITGNSISNFFFDALQYTRKNIVISRNISYLNARVDSLQKQINRLFISDKDLRLMVNLPVLEKEIKQLGIGGSIYNANAGLMNDNDLSSLKDIENMIDKISRQINFQKKSFYEIHEKFRNDEKLFECIPAIIPMSGTFDQYSFGMRRHPILGYYKMHEGVDIMSEDGTPIYAAGKGIVESVGYDGGYGLCIEINHGYGYKSKYAHLMSANITPGQIIMRGQKIANCGHSGLATGPHLHYEVSLNGVKLDPVNFFLDSRKSQTFDLGVNN